MTFIKNLTPGTRFIMSGQTTVYTCTGVGTIGNLTRVSYHTEDALGESVFTKVNLTTCKVV